jgi:hypothetical protein
MQDDLQAVSPQVMVACVQICAKFKILADIWGGKHFSLSQPYLSNVFCRAIPTQS